MLVSDLDEIAVFDTETTGVDRDTARVVTAFVGTMGRDGVLTKFRSWLINPGVQIPEQAIAVHGVTNEVASRDGQEPASAIAQINTALTQLLGRGVPVVAYNASYDLTLMDREARRHRLTPLSGPAPIIDPFIIDKHLDPYRKGSRKLVDTAAHYGVLLEGAHDAEADATATGRLAWKLLAKIRATNTLEQVHNKQVSLAVEQAASLQAYFTRIGKDAVIDGRWPVAPFTETVNAETAAA